MNIANTRWEIKILAIIAIFTAIKFSQSILFPLLLSFFLYLLFNPIVEWLEKAKFPKVISSVLIVLAFLGVISLGTTFLVQPAANWIQDAPKKFSIIEQKFQFVKQSLGKINEVAETAQDIAEITKKDEVKVATSDTNIGISLFNLTSNIIILIFTVLIFLFFFLLYFESFILNLERVVYKGKKTIKNNDFLYCLKNEVSKYMLIFSMICAGLGAVVAFTFWLIGFPNPLLWGVMAMLLTYIPYIGHLIGIIIISFISLITYDSYYNILPPPIIYFLLGVLEGQIITPIFLGNRLNLNPLIILLSIFVWGELWGVDGVIMSVPFLVTFKIILEHLPTQLRYELLLEK
ncbi:MULTISPECIES: AI-2E family transporter [Legionella]|uniref:Transporter n=1 Tax=Legionella drozanskii LLAP-1 TaxID=1212489 RepID=A0A0W0SLP4_9GAMM|nr:MULTISPECIES: AI-2E family transporter [Legionella]KTC84278.1 transporter [Legionella drozanskii LLAP-1]PJE07031.1 MAG: AI-2E family transporter [Legionella sp.]